MISFFVNSNHVIQALLATLFTWFVTAIGAAMVFLFKKVNKTVMDMMLAFAGGVMISASFWSLLLPALEMATNLKINECLSVLLGFLCGGIFLYIGDKIFSVASKKSENKKIKRCLLLIFSITLHNIPEGLAVGVAFGSLKYGLEGASLISAILLAIGIGLQNFPEGASVSIPLRREGMSRSKSFFYGQLSAVVEPIAGIVGALLVLKIRILLPFLLSFAAGAMIYVVALEIIPESQTNKKKDLMALFTIIGFCVMMVLDITLG